MDKRLVGQWYKDELGETINIFDKPIRMKMSFASSGHYNFEPNCVYEKDDWFCFEINDTHFRMVYHVKYENEKLVGFYTQFGKETQIVYKRVSSKPKNEKYKYMPTEIYLPKSKKKRLDILKKYADYDHSKVNSGYITEYVLGGDTPDILAKYRYFSYIENVEPNTDAVVFKLLDFVCDNFGHNGAGGLPAERKVEDIIKFCEEHDQKTNCRGLAILLASLLRLNNIKARHITCMPYEAPFEDCHVVVDCLLPCGKRIMLDPTSRLYYVDDRDEYISLQELRGKLIKGERIHVNANASYNGSAIDSEYNRNYMIKNTFRFSRGIYYEDGSDERTSRRVELIPAGYKTDSFPENLKQEFVYDEELFWKM